MMRQHVSAGANAAPARCAPDCKHCKGGDCKCAACSMKAGDAAASGSSPEACSCVPVPTLFGRRGND